MNRLSFVGFSFVLVMSVALLSGCGETDNDKVSETSSETDIVVSDSFDDQYSTMAELPVEKLVIHPGCIGCRKCVMIDPQHFSMDGRTATVISQDNLQSQALAQAEARCPVQVIEVQ